MNLFENGSSAQGIAAARSAIFRTQTGTHLLDTMFGPLPVEPAAEA